ncbi:MAG: hypothetical protein ACRECH_08005 [Nitrososphaerales archaeon]
MKLTTRGRDYLKATFILSLVSSLFDIKSMIALAFALAIAALISYLVLASITITTTKIVITPERTRLFKGDEFPATIQVIFKRARWVTTHLSSLGLPYGMIAKAQEMREGLIEVLIKSPYAGLFSGVQIRLELLDTLGLFSKELKTADAKFTLESMPLSILARVPAMRALPLSIGDRSARSRGSSLELYSLDEYRPFSETKNLLWKKIARMPDEKLIVRVRDAMIPKIVRIGLVESVERIPSMKLRFMDLFCEGMGALCNNLFAIGSSVEILSSTQDAMGGVEPFLILNIEQLMDVLIKTLSQNADPKDTRRLTEVIARSDIVVSGLLELEDEYLATAISKKPSLLIQDEGVHPAVVGEQAIVYSGIEDVRKLVSKVVER